MPGDVGLVAKALTPIIEWVLGPDGLEQLTKKRLMDRRDQQAQEMLKHARTQEDWDALRDFVAESKRLSVNS